MMINHNRITSQPWLLAWLLRQERRFHNWLHRLELRLAVSRAYHRFASQYPRWADSLFDEYFLAQAMQGTIPPTAVELGAAWLAQLGPRPPRSPKATCEIDCIAATFLRLLEGELRWFRER